MTMLLLSNRRSSTSSLINVKSLNKARKWYKTLILSSSSPTTSSKTSSTIASFSNFIDKSEQNLIIKNGNKQRSKKKHQQQTKFKRNECEPTSESSHQMRDRAYEICRKYLSGEWNKISSDDMIFKTVSGGLSNLLYYCSLPSTHTPMTGEPSQVLLRMYGQLLDKNDTKITDSVITMLLSERKLGPKLYGIFPGGRLEEYIPARAMSCDELSNPIYSAIIARKLAIVHHLNVPINKEPTWLNDTMKKWLQQVRNYDSNKQNHSPSSKQISTIEQELIDFDYEHEIDYMFKIIEQNCKSPVVFCHNDLQEGNILLPSSIAKTMDKFISDNNNNNNAQNSDNGDNCKNQYNGHCNDMIEVNDDHIVFIDFEFCSYNYRGFDLANHFIERMFDYSNEKWPHFFAYMDRFPNDNDKLLFIREYLKQNNELMQQRQQPIDKSLDNEQNLIKEIDFYALASHLLWTLWSINNARTSKISFGYLEYGQKRLEAYQLHKKYLNEKYCLNI